MKRFTMFACLASLALAACVPAATAVERIPAAPVVVADKTVLDEQVGIGVELAYKAARLAMELAVDSGQLKGARAAQAQTLNRQAFAFTQATQSAYRAGNATSYKSGAAQAIATISALTALLGSK